MDNPKRDILIGLSIFIIEIILLYYLWKNSLILTAALLVISIYVLFGWADREEKFVYFAGFALGPVVDLTLVPTGIWSYGNPTILGVPIWLPPAYAIGAVIMVKVGKS